MDRPQFPRRIVCLTEETTETLYLLGEQARIVGVSGYTVRPPAARRKPRVSAFTSANIEAIVALQPDLVLAFSDLQRDITRDLVGRGLTVFNFNQRSLEEILDMMGALARLVGAGERGVALEADLRAGLAAVAASAARFPRRPRVFFEEWPEPLISGIRWVEELVETAGGTPVFPALRAASAARDRIVDAAAVAARDPEVILASWCGRRVKRETICSRPGWDAIAAVANGHIYEISSHCILQPGPAALTEGVRQLHHVLCRVVGMATPPALAPGETMDHERLPRPHPRT